jgi:hypothetical protein
MNGASRKCVDEELELFFYFIFSKVSPSRLSLGGEEEIRKWGCVQISAGTFSLKNKTSLFSLFIKASLYIT